MSTTPHSRSARLRAVAVAEDRYQIVEDSPLGQAIELAVIDTEAPFTDARVATFDLRVIGFPVAVAAAVNVRRHVVHLAAEAALAQLGAPA